MTQTQARNRQSGQYSYEGNFDRLCKCGRTLGVHDAEAPHPFGDMMMDPREGLPECSRFRPATPKLTAEQKKAVKSLVEDSGYTRAEARALVLAGGGVL